MWQEGRAASQRAGAAAEREEEGREDSSRVTGVHQPSPGRPPGVHQASRKQPETQGLDQKRREHFVIGKADEGARQREGRGSQWLWAGQWRPHTAPQKQPVPVPSAWSHSACSSSGGRGRNREEEGGRRRKKEEEGGRRRTPEQTWWVWIRCLVQTHERCWWAELRHWTTVKLF